MFKTYKEAISYLETLIPLVRIPPNMQIDPLERMKALLSVLDDPQKDFVSVQVSGTSGKGSTSYLLSLALSTAGYKTGLSTSPHLERATERIKINGIEISESDFTYLLEKVRKGVEAISATSHGQPTYYEALLAVGFLYFAKQKVDIAVIEVGLEGRYDGTNTLDPILGILTNISIDHVEYLGNTVEKIAAEAVSMVKKGMTVVTGVTKQSVLSIIQDKCKHEGAALIVSSEIAVVDVKESSLRGSILSFRGSGLDISDLHLGLVGNYQVENATLALLSLEILSLMGFTVSEQHVRKAFSSAFFSGRFETLIKDGTTIILDSAHNEAKMNAFVTELERLYPNKEKIFIIAFKKEKDLISILEPIHMSAARIIISEFHTTIDVSRSATMKVDDVKEKYTDLYSDNNFLLESMPENALRRAEELAKKTGAMIVITGSMYLVGQMRSIITPDLR